MKKSELRKIIRSVIKEQASQGIWPPMGGKPFPFPGPGPTVPGPQFRPSSGRGGNRARQRRGQGVSSVEDLMRQLGNPRDKQSFIQAYSNWYRTNPTVQGCAKSPQEVSAYMNTLPLNEGILKLIWKGIKWGVGVCLGYAAGSYNAAN